MLVEKSAAKLDGLAWGGDLNPGPSKAGCCFIYIVPLGWHTIAIVPVFPAMISARSDACKRLMHEISGNGNEFDRGIQTVGSIKKDIQRSPRLSPLIRYPTTIPSAMVHSRTSFRGID